MQAWNTLKETVRRRLRSFLNASRYSNNDFKSLHPSVMLDEDVYISAPRFATLGENVAIYRGTKIFCGPGEFVMKDGSHLAGDVYVNALQGRVEIGRGTAVGPKTVIMSYSNHYKAGETIADARKVGNVRIGDDVFIGAAVVVMPGIQIGDGAIVGAGSIVTHDVAPLEIVCGNPARKMSTRPSARHNSTNSADL